MESHPLSDAIRAYLADYVTDAPTPEAAEHLTADLVVDEQMIRQELQRMQHVMSHFAYTAPPAAPPPSLRNRLMQRVAQEASGTSEPAASEAPNLDTPINFVYIREHEGEWQALGPGISAKFLYTDPDTKRHTAILRMAPGTSLPPHDHLAVEEFLVLQGDCHVAPDCVLRAGDYFRAPAGSHHDLTCTEEGTTFITMYRVAF
ncbi:MAG: hypothetical protein ETSY1_36780 [Candidatus Entotheonella factor]|uniref:ChrR-like cupin domain-containing protein n=1 Tax=Entotheonella factor TaxID=1429438 RepID=W4L7E5_ENTF1|nr:MAG: hypothetical protein ETSY1_36780 [Candidatus Entotheonella factor]